jgi:hypothetical protein
MANRIKVINFNDTITTNQAASLSTVEVSNATANSEAVSLGQMTSYVDAATAGGGATYNYALCLEDMNVGNGPIPLFYKKQFCIVLDASNSWIDINEGSGAVSVQVISSDQHFQIYDIYSSEDQHDLCKVIEDALDASALTLDYDVTYAADKITISASSNFSILWKTGAHGADNADDHIGDQIGYSDISDDTSASSHLADSTLLASPSYLSRLCVGKSDGDAQLRSEPFAGFVSITTSKNQFAIVSKWTEVDGWAQGTLTPGEPYYTASAKVTISSVNTKIDFKESGGGELTATLTSGDKHKWRLLEL